LDRSRSGMAQCTCILVASEVGWKAWLAEFLRTAAPPTVFYIDPYPVLGTMSFQLLNDIFVHINMLANEAFDLS